MGKKRSRHQNPEPFYPPEEEDGMSNAAVSEGRSKASKHHQKSQKMISTGMTAKILKEALVQQREVDDEEGEEENHNSGYGKAFSAAGLEGAVQSRNKEDEEGDIDDFSGFSETQSRFGGDYEAGINEEDERLLEAFFSKDAGDQRTLADIIIEKINQHDSNLSPDVRPMPKLDQPLIELYKGLGEFLAKYTSGKMPKVFKHIPSMQLWEDVLYITEPEKWSPNAMYQATRIFSSNLNSKKAERFYRLVLLPRIREDIKKHKRLHFSLYQALKKSIYKPAAFNKGILVPLCKSGTCNLREAVIVGSVLQKVSIPMLHSSVALLKLAEMEYCGTTSYFIKLLLEKKYALPYRVVDALVAHFMRFMDDSRVMPVIWHQSLLAFAQRYKNELLKEQKESLRALLRRQKHKLVTPEIVRELDNSRSREKIDDPMSINILLLLQVFLCGYFHLMFHNFLNIHYLLLFLSSTRLLKKIDLIFQMCPWKRIKSRYIMLRRNLV